MSEEEGFNEGVVVIVGLWYLESGTWAVLPGKKGWMKRRGSSPLRQRRYGVAAGREAVSVGF